MLQIKYGIPNTEAPLLFGGPFVLAALASPSLGILIDKIGKRLYFSKCLCSNQGFIVLLCSGCLCLAMLLTALFPSCKHCYY